MPSSESESPFLGSEKEETHTMALLAEVHKNHSLKRVSPSKSSVISGCTDVERERILRSIMAIRPIENFWATAYHPLTENREFFGLLDADSFRVPLSPENFQRSLDHSSDLWSVVLFLQHQSLLGLRAKIEAWHVNLEIQSPDASMAANSWQIMAEMTEARDVPTTKIEKILTAGFVTATEEMWKVLGSIPILYRQRYGHDIEPAAYDDIAKRSLAMIQALSTSHMRVLANFDMTTGTLIDHYGTSTTDKLEHLLLPNLALVGDEPTH